MQIFIWTYKIICIFCVKMDFLYIICMLLMHKFICIRVLMHLWAPIKANGSWKELRLEAGWDVLTMACLCLWSLGTCVWQKTKSGPWTLKVKYQLFKEWMDEVPWETALRGSGADQKYQLFKDTSLRAHELSILVCRRRSSTAWKLAWLSKDLLLKMMSKKEMHSQWIRDMWPGRSTVDV